MSRSRRPSDRHTLVAHLWSTSSAPDDHEPSAPDRRRSQKPSVRRPRRRRAGRRGGRPGIRQRIVLTTRAVTPAPHDHGLTGPDRQMTRARGRRPCRRGRGPSVRERVVPPAGVERRREEGAAGVPPPRRSFRCRSRSPNGWCGPRAHRSPRPPSRYRSPDRTGPHHQSSGAGSRRPRPDRPIRSFPSPSRLPCGRRVRSEHSWSRWAAIGR